MGTADWHKGPCSECGRHMVDQRKWNRNPRIRPGRAKSSAHGRCQACYMRGRRHGTLPIVAISSRYPVHCDQCGPVGEATSRAEANRTRTEHLATHGVQVPATRLSDAEVARLRQAVGLTDAEVGAA